MSDLKPHRATSLVDVTFHCPGIGAVNPGAEFVLGPRLSASAPVLEAVDVELLALEELHPEVKLEEGLPVFELDYEPEPELEDAAADPVEDLGLVTDPPADPPAEKPSPRPRSRRPKPEAKPAAQTDGDNPAGDGEKDA